MSRVKVEYVQDMLQFNNSLIKNKWQENEILENTTIIYILFYFN